MSKGALETQHPVVHYGHSPGWWTLLGKIYPGAPNPQGVPILPLFQGYMTSSSQRLGSHSQDGCLAALLIYFILRP